MSNIFRPLVCFAFILGLGTGFAPARAADSPAAPASPPKPVVAFFVYNRAGKDLDGKLGSFEDLLSSRLSDSGLTLVSRDTATTALSTLAGGPATSADQALDSQASALHLAQNLGAQYILVAALDSYAVTPRSFTGYGISVDTDTYTLRVSYRLCDAAQGGAIIADTVTVEEKQADTANLKQGDSDMLNQLLDDAATNLAALFTTRIAGANLPAAAAPKSVDFAVTCSMADILLPDIERMPAGDYVVGPLKYSVAPLDVTVALNGVVIGSTPGKLSGPAGLSTLSLSRQGFKDWQGFVNLSQGFKLNVALQMDDEGLARWKDDLDFLQGLKNSAKLTDAEVQRIQGIAQKLRQSGYRVDVTADKLPDTMVTGGSGGPNPWTGVLLTGAATAAK
jgi:hypothetical protein